MKITFISDTHNKHEDLILDTGDILVHCGDLTHRGSRKDVLKFAKFIAKQKFKHKIVIAGNHDFCFEDDRKEEAQAYFTDHGIIYLNDSGAEIDGIKFWGSPIQPEYHDWAFNKKRGEEIKKHWDYIPEDTDILITHGPPYGILDRCHNGESVGCEELLKRVREIAPQIHAFGHIHEDYGVKDLHGTKFINASSLNIKYEYQNPPISIQVGVST